MDVPVDHRDPLHPAYRPGVGGGDGEIAEDAETHAGRRNGVVTGRPHQCVRVVDAPVEDGIDALDDGARGEAGDVDAALPERRDAVAGIAALRQQALGLDASQVLGRMDPQDLLVSGGRGVIRTRWSIRPLTTTSSWILRFVSAFSMCTNGCNPAVGFDGNNPAYDDVSCHPKISWYAYPVATAHLRSARLPS